MSTNQSLSTLQMVRKLFASMRHLLRYVYVAVAFAVLGFLATILIPAYILHLVFQSGAPHWSALAILIGLALARGAFRYGEHYYGHYVAFRVLAEYRNAAFAKMRRLAPSKLDTQDSGALLKMIGEDIEALEVFFAHTIPPVLTASCVTLLMLPYFATVMWQLALVVGVTYALLAIGVPNFFAKKLEPLLRQQTASRKTYLSQFMESLRGVRELVQYQQVEARFATLEEYSHDVNAREREVAVVQFIQTSVTFLIVGLAVMIVATLAMSGVAASHLTVAQATTAIVVFSTSFAPFLELSRLPLGFKRAINAGRHVFDLLDEAEPNRTGKLQAPNVNVIEVENISFKYVNREQAIFEQLSVAFSGAKIIGIVGASGSGKSTLMKLLMRWYDVTNGRILIDGVPLSEVAPQAWQTKFAYIPQVPQIFNQTIRENLTLGNSNITDDAIWQAARQCNIADKIAATPQGLDTRLKNEQPIFSAGELQRLELTRALLKQADCYVFDEPTSNLDSLNEASLLQVIREHCQGLVFLISHRPSTTSCADIVYRLEKGILTKEKEQLHEAIND